MSLRSIACGVGVAVLAGAGVSGITSEPTTELVSDGLSDIPVISADGRFVAFRSGASNLVPGDTNGFFDVFVRDLQTGTTERVSVDSAGVQGNGPSGGFRVPTSKNIAISGDGRYVAFASSATNLGSSGTIGVFLHDRATRQTEHVSIGSNGQNIASGEASVAISADGRCVAFDNGVDIFVRDRSAGQTERVSVDSTGAQANNISLFPAISADGRFVAFASAATNLVAGDTNGRVDVFVHDRQSGTTELVSVAHDGAQGNFNSGVGGALGGAPVSISGDGRVVAFASSASNLVIGDSNGGDDVFVRNRTSGTTERVSIGSDGEQLPRACFGTCVGTAISADGRFIAFDSFALPGNSGDVLIHDREARTTELASVTDVPSTTATSHAPAISADGRFVVFYHFPTGDVFVRDRGGLADGAPPILTVPAEITADATSPDGAMVAFVASAIDDVDGVVAVACSPESGSIFPVATTTVTCSATDAAGNTGTATFDVTVRPFFAPFAAFNAEVEIELDEIELKALFTLGATSDGIQPKSEPVTLRVGPFEVTIPAGSFLDDGHGRVRARVHVDGFEFDARIRPEDGGFEFKIDLPRDLAALLGPTVEVSLTIGNDRGLATARVETD